MFYSSICLILLISSVYSATMSYKDASREKLTNLRRVMDDMNITAYIIPSTDDHLNEIVLEPDKRIAWMSGFTGSYGLVMVTKDEALLWTDSRYHIQAERQLDPELWKLMKQGEEGVLKAEEWLRDQYKGNNVTIAVDAKKIEASNFEKIKKSLGEHKLNLVGISLNLVDEIWKDKPSYPHDEIYVYDLKYAGETWESKVSRVIKELDGNALVVTALDEIAWLTNLRGSDFNYSPLFRSFIILTKDFMTLYIPQEKLTSQVEQHLNSENYKIKIKEYDEFWEDLNDLKNITQKIVLPNSKIGGTSFFIQDQFHPDKYLRKISPILELKSYKNPVEADGMRRAHIKDAVALCQLMKQLTEEVEKETGNWDELKVVEELKNLRRKQDLNYGQSFDTISAFGVNSALPHYRVSKETNLQITDKAPLTIDSGGQYLDGTIDTTRVVRPGLPNATEINVYTALLKGVIDVANTVFPEGTPMSKLEFIARRPLFQIGRDFGHGITHGTGVFSSVHEAFNGSLKENFIGSQEPGYYEENEFGMRLENLVIVVPAKIQNYTKKKLLTFEPLTLVPYERKLIDLSQMDTSQIKWLNDYNINIREKVGEEMLKQNNKELHDWLMVQTEPLSINN